MLTEDEKAFMAYWEANRERKKKVWNQLAVGLPLGVGIVLAIVVMVLLDWYGRAGMQLNSEASSLILVLLAAAIGIVIFVAIFSVRHRWDMNEQHYRELLQKRS